MTDDCTHLDELDAWFDRALDVVTDPAVRRDVLLLLGGAATVDEAVSVTAADVAEALDHLFVYPPSANGRSLPLTPGFLQATELSAAAWPEVRDDAEADAAAVRSALDAIDPAMDEHRLRDLRMHAWKHELGTHVNVLARCYGRALPDLLARGGDCPATRQDREIALPRQRSRVAVSV